MNRLFALQIPTKMVKRRQFRTFCGIPAAQPTDSSRVWRMPQTIFLRLFPMVRQSLPVPSAFAPLRDTSDRNMKLGALGAVEFVFRGGVYVVGEMPR